MGRELVIFPSGGKAGACGVNRLAGGFTSCVQQKKRVQRGHGFGRNSRVLLRWTPQTMWTHIARQSMTATRPRCCTPRHNKIDIGLGGSPTLDDRKSLTEDGETTAAKRKKKRASQAIPIGTHGSACSLVSVLPSRQPECQHDQTTDIYTKLRIVPPGLMLQPR